MKKVLMFFKSLLTPASGQSSKRFTALIMVFSALIFVYSYSIVIAIWPTLKDIPDNVTFLITTILYLGCGLLGLGILDKIKKLK